MVGIVYTPDDEAVWCDSCDARLIQRGDESFICSNCCKEYEPKSTLQHHVGLGPEYDPYEEAKAELPLVMLSNYGDTRKKKKGITDYEDEFLASKKSGFMITSSDEYLPAGER